MIAKKNPKLQEEKNRVVYFQLGLLVTGTSLLMAFTWKTPVNKSEKLIVERSSEIEMIQMMEEEIEKPIEIPEVKKVVQKKAPDQITIKMLTQFINPIKNSDKNEKIDVQLKAKDGDKIGNGDFILDIGDAPDLNVIIKFPHKEAFFGGNWTTFLKNNLKYPTFSQEWGDEGNVFLSFIVEKDGSVSQIIVKNKDRVTKELQEEAIRVIKASPKWNPGINNRGEYVRSYKNVNVNFVLK
jgi:protein TonB